jgi:hypothetical protein
MDIVPYTLDEFLELIIFNYKMRYPFAYVKSTSISKNDINLDIDSIEDKSLID